MNVVKPSEEPPVDPSLPPVWLGLTIITGLVSLVLLISRCTP